MANAVTNGLTFILNRDCRSMLIISKCIAACEGFVNEINKWKSRFKVRRSPILSAILVAGDGSMASNVYLECITKTEHTSPLCSAKLFTQIRQVDTFNGTFQVID